MTPEQIKSQAIRVVNQVFVGMLTTVDGAGRPHARWMGSATLAGGLTTLYTLAGKTTRKVEHIRGNPRVCWVFTAPHYEDVVTIYGQAKVLNSPLVAQSVWDRLMDCARVYCMSAMTDEDDPEFVTIETAVQRIEYYSPRQKLFQPVSVVIAEG